MSRSQFRLASRDLCVFLPAIVQQVQAGHADDEAVGDLIEDDGMWAVGDFGGDLDAAIDRARGEDQDVGFCSADAVAVHAEEVRVLADRREERGALPLELNPQQVDAIALAENLIEVVRDFDAQPFNVRGDECRRAADDDSCSEFLQAPNVRAGDAAMQDVADQRDSQAGDAVAMLSDREDVEQSLRRMLVSSVSRIEHARLEQLRQQMRRAGGAVSHDDLIDSHRFDVLSGVVKRLALRQAAGRGGEVDGVGTQTFGCEAEARLRACRRLKEKVRNDAPFEGTQLRFTLGGQPFEFGGLIQNESDFVGGKLFQTEQMFLGPTHPSSGRSSRGGHEQSSPARGKEQSSAGLYRPRVTASINESPHLRAFRHSAGEARHSLESDRI